MEDYVISYYVFPYQNSWEFTVVEVATGLIMLSNEPMGVPSPTMTTNEYIETAKQKTRTMGKTWFPV